MNTKDVPELDFLEQQFMNSEDVVNKLSDFNDSDINVEGGTERDFEESAVHESTRAKRARNRTKDVAPNVRQQARRSVVIQSDEEFTADLDREIDLQLQIDEECAGNADSVNLCPEDTVDARRNRSIQNSWSALSAEWYEQARAGTDAFFLGRRMQSNLYLLQRCRCWWQERQKLLNP